MIIDHSQTKELSDRRITEVAKWELASNENFLKSMLINRQDAIAAEYGNLYPLNDDEKKALMKFAINNSNEIFLKYAFKNDIFNENIF